MKKSQARSTAPLPAKAKDTPGRSIRPAKIHPVVIYPFHQPSSFSHLEQLYSLVAWLEGQKQTYARPITVVDRKTFYANARNKQFLEFRETVVAKHSDLLDAWCVDTCQMWYLGLGQA